MSDPWGCQRDVIEATQCGKVTLEKMSDGLQALGEGRG